MPGEAAARLQIEIDPGERDRSLDLGAVAHDARIGHQRLDLRRVVVDDDLGPETVEGGAERLALAQDRDPGKSRLETIEDEFFEQGAVVPFRHAPLLVMIGDIERIGARPGAAVEGVGMDDGGDGAGRLGFGLGLGLVGHGLSCQVGEPGASGRLTESHPSIAATLARTSSKISGDSVSRYSPPRLAMSNARIWLQRTTPVVWPPLNGTTKPLYRA